MKAKKSLGQNFLIDNNIIKKIVEEINVTNDDLIIEIGPGKGALTKQLKTKKTNLICYEIDQDLKNILTPLEDDKTKIIYQDFLKADILNDIKDYKYNNLYIVGNLPYYITTPIIEHLLNANIKFKKLTIMIQKEVAERFMAKPGTRDYGYFTVLLDYYFNINRVCNVSRNSFNPIPNVDSTILSLSPKENINIDDKTKYFNFVKQCFAQKRKTLRNNLRNYNWTDIELILNKYGFNDSVRAEELNQDDFISMYKKLFNR